MSKKKDTVVEVIRSLPVPLTEREIRTKAGAMARLLQKADNLDQKAKDVGASIRAEAREARADATEFRTQIIQESENRPVRCVERLDAKRNVVDIIREDTGEVVDTRPAQPGDRQLSMVPPLSSEASAKKAASKKAASKKGDK